MLTWMPWWIHYFYLLKQHHEWWWLIDTGSCVLFVLILLALGLENSRRTRTVLWLLMHWFIVLPGHQQQWYWLGRINGLLSSWRKDFNYLHHLNQGSTLSFLAGCPKSHFVGWYRNFLVYWYLKLDNQVVNSTCPKGKLGWIWRADDP